MAETRSDRAHALWFESSTRFDYYLTGLTVALIAYWGKNLSPPAAVVSRESLLAVALLVLLASVLLGLLRMEKNIQVSGLSFEQLRLSEDAQVLETASAENSLLHDVVHGVIQTPAQAKRRADRLRAKSKETEQVALVLGRTVARLYKWRGRALALGLLLAIVSRIWPVH